MNIKVFTQSAILLSGKKNIYFDPFKIEQKLNDADYIFITHAHYDHYDRDSINKVIKKTTKIIVPEVLEEEISKLTKNYLVVKPNQSYKIDELEFQTVHAYNIHKSFHPKEANFVGYIIRVEDTTYYIMGDTDVLEENKKLKVDVCFIPIGGHFTMDYKEAADYINEIKPKKVIPIHYGSIIGDITLGEKFKKLINKEIEVEMHIKEENV